MESNVTRLPWVVEVGNGETWVAPADHDWAVCKVFSGGKGEEGTQANAAFIVRACNSYDQLVAALSQALGVMEENCRGTGGKDYSDGAIEAARAALAKAGSAP